METTFNPGYWADDELSKFGFRKVGTNVRVAKNCIIIGLDNISIGDNVRIDGPTVLSAASGYIRIGSHVHIGGMAFLAGGGGIELDDFSGLSQGVRIYSTSDDYSGAALTNPTVPKDFLNVKVAPVILGRHVIVGSGSIILPGCSIGEGASIGALSLVTKSLGPWGVYFGTPVKRLRARSRRLLKLEEEFMKKA
ncbi:bacterial transferase hexapeptide family protein [Paraburkholderia xenovorans LB400]|uniref:Chloramphenicol acetyltransferase n=1 Tax=Paraburkholderia xenovorans (strain LB400) TaxID=266265 RepID=Q13ZD4_PARXL|nr:acyltransferase [Paraburkholderia xenovorans]ABE30555.1 Putative o-acyltransferase, CysE/LacA/LpxA/NodL family [Paraburkholderia xenovorans LB400]AIP30012.1 bacterial transferase hexapeptide family protein [Paraburkholderia xenovorans LB400]